MIVPHMTQLMFQNKGLLIGWEAVRNGYLPEKRELIPF